ncbi:hypothetical protein QA600_21985 [Natronococcus sp. A-GB1]|uniref:hypothetical protein n=1 Tax=Natronococcus sp. A-GB1 TaxID=3037648 RepID=UPI00241F987D|nr:hypothetical protein [Natronococcus sp. A-GB1]MDG5761989.1 hypothetical protein [Natronococcus sp. A-GB1]
MIGVPALVLGLWWARRGSIRGRLVWLGAIAYMMYMWTHYAFVIAYNDFFIGYVALFGLSVFTLVSGVASTDADEIRALLHGRLSTSFYVGFLAITALGLGLMWLSEIVPALLADEHPSAIAQLGPKAAHTYVIDLGLLVPALGITAVWLRWERSWGYVWTGSMLVFAALIAPTLTAITVIDLLEGLDISVFIIVGTIVPPVIGLVFAVSYLRRLPQSAAY